MLSRGTSNASQRPQPRQAKSSSSVGLRPTGPTESSTIDSEILHHHALTAANLAYDRANRRETAKKGVTKADGGQETGNLTDSEGKPQLGRRQSIRFTGPNATALMTRSSTRREVPPHSASIRSPRHSLQSQMRDSETSYLANEESFTVIPEEFGESDIASMPSSYRKIRKARSVFSPGKAPSAVFADGTPGATRHFHRHSLQSSDGSEERFRVPNPRLERSYSFLRGVTDRIMTSNRQYATHDTAIQLARDTYLRQLEEQRLKEQPSFLNLGKCRTQKSIRRTVRSSITNSYGTAIASPMTSIEPAKVGLSQKARSISKTLKRKIKRVFRRSLDDQPTIPAQQLKANHAHYRDYGAESNGLGQQYPDVSEPNTEPLRRVSSRESKESDAPVFVDKGSRSGSIQSAHSSSDDDERNDRSRVTSWTNSTAANTITMPQMMERKLLSIIKENGDPYQPSSPTRKYGSINDGYAEFRQPVRQDPAGGIETKRVFSALQREIHKNDRKAALEHEESDINSVSHGQRTQMSMSTPRRTSSMRRGAVSPLPTVPQLTEAQVTYPSYKQNYSELRQRLTPQEIADMNESGLSRSRGPLREMKSAFFPPSMRIERSKTSPFRRALKGSSEDGDGPQFDNTSTGQLREVGHVNLDRRRLNGSTAGSESIYSRSPGGHTMKAIGSSLSLPKSEGSGEAGTAVIITSERAKHQPPLIGRRYSSGDLSGTFKKFMATQVASLENDEPRHDQIYNVFSLRESGHRRENAQFDGDDVSIDRQQASKDPTKQPLGIIPTNANAQSLLKYRAPFSTCEGCPFKHTGSSPKGSTIIQNQNNPFGQSFLFGRKPTNVENAKVSSGLIFDLVGELPRKYSQTPILSQRDQNRVSPAVNVRHSPERAERLRRLRSKSSTSLRKTPTQKENAAQDNCATSTNHWQQGHDSDNSEASPAARHCLAAGNQKLVESSLKVRRREMRISEESGGDHHFL